MGQKVAVLGAGSWGSALAKCLAENGHQVRLWGNKQSDIDAINTTHINVRYLPDVLLPTSIQATTCLKTAIDAVDTIVFVVPTAAMREVAQQVNALLAHEAYIIHAGKGLEQHTHKRISEILAEELSLYKAIVVLSGPSHAEEVANKDLTTITAASDDLQAACYVQQLFMNHYFRIYTNTDVIGVELGAALKNIIAIGAGVLHGVGYGDNAKAALMTRGLAEISRLGVAFGADPLTFIGLSGVGDLIVTCTSVHSRNWRLGDMLGKGCHLEQAMTQIDMAVEGVWTAKAAYDLAQEKQIDMPITTAIYDVLYHQKNVVEVIQRLMERDGKSEKIEQALSSEGA